MEFNELWQGIGGPDPASKRTRFPKVQIGDASFESYFAPEDDVMAKILKEVESAARSIDVMAFAFTSPQLAELLIAKAEKGVAVRCLLDPHQASNKFSRDEALSNSDVALRLSENRSGRMHHKVIIIDGREVITGSFNFSSSADRKNDENTLFIKSKPIAEIFSEEFNRCWRGIKGY